MTQCSLSLGVAAVAAFGQWRFSLAIVGVATDCGRSVAVNKLCLLFATERYVSAYACILTRERKTARMNNSVYACACVRACVYVCKKNSYGRF